VSKIRREKNFLVLGNINMSHIDEICIFTILLHTRNNRYCTFLKLVNLTVPRDEEFGVH